MYGPTTPIFRFDHGLDSNGQWPHANFPEYRHATADVVQAQEQSYSTFNSHPSAFVPQHPFHFTPTSESYSQGQDMSGLLVPTAIGPAVYDPVYPSATERSYWPSLPSLPPMPFVTNDIPHQISRIYSEDGAALGSNQCDSGKITLPRLLFPVTGLDALPVSSPSAPVHDFYLLAASSSQSDASEATTSSNDSPSFTLPPPSVAVMCPPRSRNRRSQVSRSTANTSRLSRSTGIGRADCAMPGCGAGFASWKELLRHLQDHHHIEDKAACIVPGCSAKPKQAHGCLLRHIREHYVRYVCPDCEFTTTRVNRLKSHLAVVHALTAEKSSLQPVFSFRA